MEMRGRKVDGYVYVDPLMLTENATRAWLQLALAFVQTLPPKAPDSNPRGRKENGRDTHRARSSRLYRTDLRTRLRLASDPFQTLL
jgi:hypothetical protein